MLVPGQDPRIGTLLAGMWRAESLLGAGGFGRVYLARHDVLGRLQAIKVFESTYSRPDLVDRFYREAKILEGLDNPHIIKIRDFGKTEDSCLYYSMDYFKGESLSATLRREGPLAWSRVRSILLQICEAIGEAHRKGVIHRDLKPANCLRIFGQDDPDFGSTHTFVA